MPRGTPDHGLKRPFRYRTGRCRAEETTLGGGTREFHAFSIRKGRFQRKNGRVWIVLVSKVEVGAGNQVVRVLPP